MAETIVLLHGLGRTPMGMLPIALAARRRGFRVINWRYPSRRRSIAAHAEAFEREVVPRLRGASRVHFITHSLGGIVVRHVLARHPLPNAGRVVMLAPPNGGSEVADVLEPFLGRLVRPLCELGVEAARSFPPVEVPCGVIAGSRSHIPLFARWMRGVPNDGVVAVGRTRVAGMSGFLVLRRTHTFLPWAPEAIRQALAFVERGAFDGAQAG